ncbi:MAG: replication initiation factor domain-containing protein [Pirellulales bacterium]|nr:replication initiation factor domain-containing protein [Pirellulales bacterium]
MYIIDEQTGQQEVDGELFGIRDMRDAAEERQAVRSTAAATAPPLLSGGVKCQKISDCSQDVCSEVSVHWIQGTVPWEKTLSLVNYLSKVFKAEPIRRDYGMYRYDSGYEWFNGVRVFTDTTRKRNDDIHNGRSCVMIPGEACDSLEAERLWLLIRDLCYKFWCLATRLDCAFDDFRRSVTLDQVKDAAMAGNFSGFRRWKPDEPRTRSGEYEGRAVYFGRRGKDGGGRYLRVYDKGLESGGKIDSIRWEPEFCKHKARAALWLLAQQDTLEGFTTANVTPWCRVAGSGSGDTTAGHCISSIGTIGLTWRKPRRNRQPRPPTTMQPRLPKGRHNYAIRIRHSRRSGVC